MSNAHQMPRAVQTELRTLAGNTVCADCESKSPQWASVSYGSLFCLECSGVHRSLGVHLSFVRSITMDSWTEEQITAMRLGGNQQLIDFFAKYGIQKTDTIQKKYSSPAAELYRRRLKAKMQGVPENKLPTDLIAPAAPVSPSAATISNDNNNSTGKESEYDKVIRERAEAKARLEAKFGKGGLKGNAVASQALPPDMNDDRPGNTSKLPGLDIDMDNLKLEAEKLKNKAAQGLSTLKAFGIDVFNKTSEVAKTEAQNFDIEKVKSSTKEGWTKFSAQATSFWGKASEFVQQKSTELQQKTNEWNQTQPPVQAPATVYNNSLNINSGATRYEDLRKSNDNQVDLPVSRATKLEEDDEWLIKELEKSTSFSEPAPQTQTPRPKAKLSTPKKEEDDFFSNFGVK